MRVCLLSLLHCFPTPACPSCSLALILPVAAQRPNGSLQRQLLTPTANLQLFPPSSGLPLVASGLAPRTHPSPHRFRSHTADLRNKLGRGE